MKKIDEIMNLIDDLKHLSKLLRIEQDFYKREGIILEMEKVLSRLKYKLSTY